VRFDDVRTTFPRRKRVVNVFFGGRDYVSETFTETMLPLPTAGKGEGGRQLEVIRREWSELAGYLK